MQTIKEISPFAQQILKKHFLCDSCLGRLFSKQLNLSSNRRLGKILKKNSSIASKKCYICKNLLDNLTPYLKLMLDSSFDYEFSSFVVGAIIKPSIIDRDDYIRSKFQLRGIDSVKTEITHELSRQFSRKTKKIINFLDPDVTFTVNFKEETCQLRSKQVSVSGRYNKTKRNYSQKQKPCENCSGKGCRICDFHGISNYDSVEGKISEFLFNTFGGTTAKFTWIGGEDKSSLVLGSGRPFFVRLQNPKKRKVRFPKNLKTEFLQIHHFKLISDFPKKPIPFRSIIEMKISTNEKLSPLSLKNLKKSLKTPVVIYEPSGKRTEKKIFEAKYKKNSDNKFTLTINVEGGFPVKRFVLGDNVVPGVSQKLDNNCKLDEFDFFEIQMITNN